MHAQIFRNILRQAAWREGNDTDLLVYAQEFRHRQYVRALEDDILKLKKKIPILSPPIASGVGCSSTAMQ